MLPGPLAFADVSCRRLSGRAVTTAAAVGVLLVGCTTHAGKHPTQTSIASSTSTTLSLEAAAERYSRLADALNSRVATETGRLVADGANLTRLRIDYQGLADAYRTFDQAVRLLVLPDGTVRPDVQALLRADSTLLLAVQAGAYAHDTQELAQIEREVATAGQDRVGLVKVVRHDLGLPPSQGG